MPDCDSVWGDDSVNRDSLFERELSWIELRIPRLEHAVGLMIEGGIQTPENVACQYSAIHQDSKNGSILEILKDLTDNFKDIQPRDYEKDTSGVLVKGCPDSILTEELKFRIGELLSESDELFDLVHLSIAKNRKIITPEQMSQIEGIARVAEHQRNCINQLSESIYEYIIDQDIAYKTLSSVFLHLESLLLKCEDSLKLQIDE